eukprot:scaffold45999_cov37-Prasinocladus_malaysianus.AAC.5
MAQHMKVIDSLYPPSRTTFQFVLIAGRILKRYQKKLAGEFGRQHQTALQNLRPCLPQEYHSGRFVVVTQKPLMSAR